LCLSAIYPAQEVLSEIYPQRNIPLGLCYVIILILSSGRLRLSLKCRISLR